MIANRSLRVGGSFRDPAGYVFRQGSRVFRTVDRDSLALFHELSACGLLADLARSGLIVESHIVTDAAEQATFAADHPAAGYLEHRPLEPITYPYEWCVSMLADAGIHTLDLQLCLLDQGYALKDASAYNVQFPGPKPLFIDVGSIERPRRPDLWYALGQFGQMFVHPLLLAVHSGWDLRSYFLGSLGGRSLEQVAGSLGRLERWRPRYLLDVTLPLILGRRAERRSAGADLGRPKAGAGPQKANLERLRQKLRALAGRYRPRGVWTDYTATCSYDERAEQAKKGLVRDYLERVRPARVVDVGCNTGDYSYIAARTGARVIAVDADHDAVETLYRRLRREPASITPIVAGAAAPSPAVGFRNRERASLVERAGDADCVLALALVHHLQVHDNLTLEAQCELFSDLTRTHLVLEFVPPDDPAFVRMLRFRSDRFDDFSLERCRAAFGESFSIVGEAAIPGTRRTLLFMERRQ
jgi:SAM-dependent methyltransferase